MHTPFLPGLRPFLAPMGSRSAPALKSCRRITLAQIETRFAPCLPPAVLRQNPEKEFSRERIYTQVRTFWCWMWQILQGNTSCREVVRQVQALFALCGARSVDGDTGGYCLARFKLGLTCLERIFAGSIDACRKAAPSGTLLQGRPLRVVDGSGVRLPDTPANRQAFPPNNKEPGTGFPFLRVTALFCLGTGAILARVTGTLNTSEGQAMGSLCSPLARGDILIGDRAYGLHVFAAVLQGCGVDLLARLSTRNRRVDYRRAVRRFGVDDALFVWRKGHPSKLLSPEQWAALPEELTVRIIRHRVVKKGFRTKELTIVTTLLDPQLYPREEILEAYLRRWRMEMCLDDLKSSLGMEMLTCRSPAMVEKELLMFLIAHNFLRWIMLQAAPQVPGAAERISFKGTLDAFRQWSQALAQLSSKRGAKGQARKLWSRLLETLAADAVPERPCRREPRAVKGRPKYGWLNQARHVFKERPSRSARRRQSRANKRTALN